MNKDSIKKTLDLLEKEISPLVEKNQKIQRDSNALYIVSSKGTVVFSLAMQENNKRCLATLASTHYNNVFEFNLPGAEKQKAKLVDEVNPDKSLKGFVSFVVGWYELNKSIVDQLTEIRTQLYQMAYTGPVDELL